MISRRAKVALVTGASRGIGAEVAVRLVSDGFHIIINFSGSADEANALINKVRQTGGQAMAMRADVSDSAAVRELFERADVELGGVDVLVNNAGVQKLGALAEMSDDDFDSEVNISLKGSFNTMREAARRMRDGGRVINLSSGTTTVPQPRYGAYAATKAGVEALTAILAKEFKGRNITVNAVAPGPVATELFLKGKSQEDVDKAAHQSPLERLGQPADIASVISFLAGPDGSWVIGQTVVVNGAFM